jgi:hypothetical protein
MAQHLDVLVPELTSVMREGFQSLNTSVAAVQAQNEAYYKKYEIGERATRTLIADSLRQAANRIEGTSVAALPSSVQSEVEISSNELSYVETPPRILEQHSEAPEYKIDRNVFNVIDVWREYTVGIKGGPAIEYLERNFQTKWRQDRTESRYFSSRLVLYNEIKKISETSHISKDEAAEKLEKRRQELKFTLYKLTKSIIEKNKGDKSFTQ